MPIIDMDLYRLGTSRPGPAISEEGKWSLELQHLLIGGPAEVFQTLLKVVLKPEKDSAYLTVPAVSVTILEEATLSFSC